MIRLPAPVGPALWVFGAVLSLLALGFPGPGRAAPGAMGCFECHDRAAFQKKVKHDPAASGDCAACHSPHAAKHKGLLRKKVQTLCYSCHEDAAADHVKGRAHQPVREGQCLACHDPHGSDYPDLLSKSPSETCFSCHTDLPKRFAHTHTPYARGQCSSCHAAHQSTEMALLVKAPEALCLGCHPIQTVRQKHPNYPAELGSCGSCHSPHGSDRKGLVRNVLHDPYQSGCGDCHVEKGAPVPVDTCLGCHEAIGEQMATSLNHLVRFGNNSCLACHSPHAGDGERLLKGKERHVCRACHEGTFRKMEDTPFQHQLTQSCTDCHAPHGSNHPTMTRGPMNAVCVACHVKHEEFTHPIGESVFDPRTGQVMTCASCHASKGTGHPYHLRFSGKRDLCVQCHRDH